MSDTKKQSVGEVFIYWVLAVGLTFSLAWPVLEMWRWTVVPLFHGPAISYAQAWGLLALLAFPKLRTPERKSDKQPADYLNDSISINISAYIYMFILWILLRLA